MKRIFALLAALALSTTLTGCYGRIHTGDVGLRTDFNGHVAEQVEGEGFYTTFTSHVAENTIKEIVVDLNNLTPKAKDNLSLAELDVSVYYRLTSGDAVRRQFVKRSGQSRELNDGSAIWAPQYAFIDSLARSEVADAVSRHDSLTIHTQRTTLEKEVKDGLQKTLDASDAGDYQVTRVVVRQVRTDPTVEQSIRNVVAKGKELEAATLQVQVAEKNAEAVAKTANTLTPAFLQHEYNLALQKFADSKNATVILDGSTSGKMINIPR